MPNFILYNKKIYDLNKYVEICIHLCYIKLNFSIYVILIFVQIMIAKKSESKVNFQALATSKVFQITMLCTFIISVIGFMAVNLILIEKLTFMFGLLMVMLFIGTVFAFQFFVNRPFWLVLCRCFVITEFVCMFCGFVAVAFGKLDVFFLYAILVVLDKIGAFLCFKCHERSI